MPTDSDYSIRVSQGSVATRFGCGGIFNDSFIENLPESLTVKGLRKSVADYVNNKLIITSS